MKIKPKMVDAEKVRELANGIYCNRADLCPIPTPLGQVYCRPCLIKRRLMALAEGES